MKKTPLLVAQFTFAVLFLTTAVHTAQAAGVEGSVGAKGGIGGNYLNEPDDAAGLSGIFTDGGGGLGGGGGIFGEVRFLHNHLGLEVDLLLDANKTWCDFNDVDFIMKYTSLTIPVLIKGSITQGITRLALGFGPEFRIGVNAKAEMDAPSNIDVSALNFTATKRNDVALAWELAFAFAVSKLEITLDLRFAANLTLPKSYMDRVHLSDNYTNAESEAAHSVDARVLVGVAYVFGR